MWTPQNQDTLFNQDTLLCPNAIEISTISPLKSSGHLSNQDTLSRSQKWKSVRILGVLLSILQVKGQPLNRGQKCPLFVVGFSVDLHGVVIDGRGSSVQLTVGRCLVLVRGVVVGVNWSSGKGQKGAKVKRSMWEKYKSKFVIQTSQVFIKKKQAVTFTFKIWGFGVYRLGQTFSFLYFESG